MIKLYHHHQLIEVHCYIQVSLKLFNSFVQNLFSTNVVQFINSTCFRPFSIHKVAFCIRNYIGICLYSVSMYRQLDRVQEPPSYRETVYVEKDFLKYWQNFQPYLVSVCRIRSLSYLESDYRFLRRPEYLRQTQLRLQREGDEMIFLLLYSFEERLFSFIKKKQLQFKILILNRRVDALRDQRAGSYLSQRIRLAIQRQNEASLLGTDYCRH